MISEPKFHQLFDEAVRRLDSSVTDPPPKHLSEMNQDSFKMYMTALKAMLTGGDYRMQMNLAVTEYSLKRIADEYEPAVLRQALAVIKRRYSPDGGKPMPGLRKLHKKYSSLLGSLPTEVDGDQLRTQVEAEISSGLSDDPKRRLQRLAAYEGNTRSYQHTVRAFRRNMDVVSETLIRANGHCGHCSQPAPFKTSSGRPFLEVHHIIPLAEKGPDTLENTIALCPNCHREAHLGENKGKFRW